VEKRRASRHAFLVFRRVPEVWPAVKNALYCRVDSIVSDPRRCARCAPFLSEISLAWLPASQ